MAIITRVPKTKTQQLQETARTIPLSSFAASLFSFGAVFIATYVSLFNTAQFFFETRSSRVAREQSANFTQLNSFFFRFCVRATSWRNESQHQHQFPGVYMVLFQLRLCNFYKHTRTRAPLQTAADHSGFSVIALSYRGITRHSVKPHTMADVIQNGQVK